MAKTLVRTLVRTVDLVFFCDDANGEYGTAHRDTIENTGNSGFNAFWDGRGMFHDVFEHAHEYTDEYFRGDNAMNIGGEMAAMGSFFYYMSDLGLYDRLDRRYGQMYTDSQQAMNGTLSLVQESITMSHCQFGYTLDSGVPKQAPIPDSGLEEMIDTYFAKVKTFTVPDRVKEKHERSFSLCYKKSVTKSKIANLHRYGYKLAEKLVPFSCYNVGILSSFIGFWDKFCKLNDAEKMDGLYYGVQFRIYHKGDAPISWEATFNSKYNDDGYTDFTVNQDSEAMEIESYIEDLDLTGDFADVE